MVSVVAWRLPTEQSISSEVHFCEVLTLCEIRKVYDIKRQAE
jgi:hypothetical protein